MRTRRPLWLGAQLLAALGVVALRATTLGWMVLLPWLAAILGVIALIGLGVRGSGGRRARHGTDPDVLGALFLGIGWAVAMALFSGPAADAAIASRCSRSAARCSCWRPRC